MNKLHKLHNKLDNLETIIGYVEEAYYELKAAEEEVEKLTSNLLVKAKSVFRLKF